jgi:undecaprenyl-diphosphatase
MTYSQAIFLAIIQGITEFLPISSSGHLVIFQKIFGLKPPILFDVLVHVGTLGAIFFFFKRRLTGIIKGLAQRDQESINFVCLIAIGSVPAVVMGFLLKSYLEMIFNSLKLVGFSLLLTSFLLFSTRKASGKKHFNQLKWPESLLIGVFQALAILPGVSRSGATISAGFWQKLDQKTAFEFSFLLAIPAIVGALTLEIPALIYSSPGYLAQGILGMIIAGLVGHFSLKILKQTLFSKKFWVFGVYCFFLGLLVLLLCGPR